MEWHLEVGASELVLGKLGLDHVGAGDGLDTINLTTPCAATLVILVVEVGGCRPGDLGELSLVLAPDLSQGNNSGLLLVYNGAEAGTALDNDVRDTHLDAERGEEDDELEGVDIVGNDDELGLL